ncbi:MAG TPA: 50S ribosomal protein L11 methyltransferase [Thermoanaerobaculia bacterium]|nr:50S ribosomal protein L11 methyltransferase [Thermoanaerobaculia bacterium]
MAARDEAASRRAGSGWWRLRVELPAEALDAVLELLACAPCCGTWSRAAGAGEALERPSAAASRYEVDAWFDCGALPAELAGELARQGARVLDWAPAVDHDWLEEYRRSARPIRVGRFLLDPREPADARADPIGGDGLERLALPARTAFGTGSHETTRLMVEELLGCGVEGRRVLDVGTGTGVLGLVAARLGARRVVGFDVDPVASLLAVQNAALNRTPLALFAGGVDALAPSTLFDLVLVNVLPENLGGREAAIASHLGCGGELLVSGVLGERAGEISGRWAALGLELRAMRSAGEWVLLRMAFG